MLLPAVISIMRALRCRDTQAIDYDRKPHLLLCIYPNNCELSWTPVWQCFAACLQVPQRSVRVFHWTSSPVSVYVYMYDTVSRIYCCTGQSDWSRHRPMNRWIKKATWSGKSSLPSNNSSMMSRRNNAYMPERKRMYSMAITNASFRVTMSLIRPQFC